MGHFNKYLWKRKIDVSDFTLGEEHYIVLREPNVAEFKQLTKMQKAFDGDEVEGTVETIESFVSLASTLIVDHNFYNEEDTEQRLPAKEVAEFLGEKLGLANYVMSDYFSNLPLLQGSEAK